MNANWYLPSWYSWRMSTRSMAPLRWPSALLAVASLLPLLSMLSPGPARGAEPGARGNHGAALAAARASELAFVSAQWCSFFPQIASCPASPFTLPPRLRRGVPQGMVAVPVNYCDLIPSLPICNTVADKSLTEVTNFGSNPGALKMFKYVPQNLGAARPLVVALHGCTQSASSYNDEPGWIQLADKYRFALLLPQETVHSVKCFRWYDAAQSERGKGEALSIKQMIDKMGADLSVDPKRIYVTGLSAGGAMTAVMLAAYPELFAGAGIVAGVPFRCASTENYATQKCGVLNRAKMVPAKKNMTPRQWGDLVRRASDFTGPFPRVSIWHGDADAVVDPQNLIELTEQWTDVLGASPTPATDEEWNGNGPHPIRHRIYSDAGGNARVATFQVRGMGHAVPVDPGGEPNQCGTEARPYVFNAGICSSIFIAKFLGIDK